MDLFLKVGLSGFGLFIILSSFSSLVSICLDVVRVLYANEDTVSCMKPGSAFHSERSPTYSPVRLESLEDKELKPALPEKRAAYVRWITYPRDWL